MWDFNYNAIIALRYFFTMQPQNLLQLEKQRLVFYANEGLGWKNGIFMVRLRIKKFNIVLLYQILAIFAELFAKNDCDNQSETNINTRRRFFLH
jgi:hypothetical protein